ncbi:MAG: hypothetical protein IJN80_05305 [Clostridia bacterium]|nr:hypothetical protein [Clostridia bacterium]
MKNTVKLSEVEIGKSFRVGGESFIKMEDNDGKITVVAKGVAFKSEYGNNDFSKSKVLERLNKEFLPMIEKEVGAENICDFETDLTTLDGLKGYGKINSKISIPTFDFYRKHVDLFDMYKVNDWWWLATADTALPHCDPSWRLCVSPRGGILNDGDCNDDCLGVRPILCFVSSISVSCED